MAPVVAPRKKDPSPGFPPEQKSAGIAAIAAGATNIAAALYKPLQPAAGDITNLAVAFGGMVVGSGTILRFRRIGNDKIVQDSINRAGKDGDGIPDWQELPRRYATLILAASGFAIAVAALLLLLT